MHICKVRRKPGNRYTEAIRLRNRHVVPTTPASNLKHRQNICSGQQHHADGSDAEKSQRPPGAALPHNNGNAQQCIHPRDLCVARANGEASDHREKRSRTSRWPSDTADDRCQDPWRPSNSLDHIWELRLRQQHTRKCKRTCRNHRCQE